MGSNEVQAPAILITSEWDQSESFLAELKSIADSSKFPCEIRSIEPHGPQASIEWLTPTVLTIWVLKPYFNAFLSEMGKEHYQILKQGLKKAWAFYFSPARTFKNIQIRGGIIDESPPKYSRSFCVIAKIDDVHYLKLLIEDQIDEQTFEDLMDAFFDFASCLATNPVLKTEFLARPRRFPGTTKMFLLARDENSKNAIMEIDPFPAIKL